MTHQPKDINRMGCFVYIIMASFGTLALLRAFGLLAGPGRGYGFAAIREIGAPPGLTGLVLALALLGTGSKAGLVPLHVWLPLAHPAAPSHVSALMSGVMTKVAIYAFIRIVRSEEHTSELQSLMRISYAVFCLKKKTKTLPRTHNHDTRIN